MSKEKFDPYDPKYGKVEDLPEEQRRHFANVDGGFVKNEVLRYHDRVEKEQQENEGVVDKLRNVLENLLEGDGKTRKEKVLAMIMQQATLHNILGIHIDNPPGIEKPKNEERESVILRLIDQYCENLEIKIRAKYLGPMQEALQHAGHHGELFVEECRGASPKCKRLYGSIDGNSVDVHLYEGNAAAELFKAYGRIAVDPIRYHSELTDIAGIKALILDILKGKLLVDSVVAEKFTERPSLEEYLAQPRHGGRDGWGTGLTRKLTGVSVDAIAEHFKLSDKDTEELWPMLTEMWRKRSQGLQERQQQERQRKEDERESRKRADLERIKHLLPITADESTQR